MAPKNSQKAKPEELAADAGVDIQPAAGKDKSKVPGGKAGGAASAKRPAKDRKASSKKAHSSYAGGSQEVHASKLTVEDDAKDDVEKAVADGDKAADKIQAQVDKQDGEFDPDNAAEDEVEAVPEDEADDAGEDEEEMEDKEVAAAAQAEDEDADEVEEPEAAVDDNDLNENNLAEDDEEEDYEDDKPPAKKAKGAAKPAVKGADGKNAAGNTVAVAKGGKNNDKGAKSPHAKRETKSKTAAGKTEAASKGGERRAKS